MDDNERYITDNVPEAEILTQLAEEAAELAQAALKLRRAMGDTHSPTPVTENVARDRLLEEIADVSVCIRLLFPTGGKTLVADLERTMGVKIDRWAHRLRGVEADG